MPPDARWVGEDDEWEQGTIDARGLKQGPFTYWRADGTRCNECVLKDGRPHGAFRRFHENGEISQEGTYLEGALHGTRRWIACDEPTTERMHEGGVSELVRVSEMDYARGRVVAIRHFDADGNRVTPEGERYPERPEGVPDGAEYQPDDDVWKSGSADGESGAREGRWRVWSTSGQPISDLQYEHGVRQGPAREWVFDPNPFVDEEVVCEVGQYERDQRVGRWRFLDQQAIARFEVDYGIGQALDIPHLEAWSNVAGQDWQSLGTELLARGQVRAALVTLARACAVAKSTAPLASALEGHVRVLKDEAARAFADQAEGLPTLCTALVDGCSLPHVLRKLAIALDQALQSRAALDFVNAAILFAPEAAEFLFTRTLILMSLGLTHEAARDASDLASASPDQAEFLLDYLRFLFPTFGFWPAAETPQTTKEGLPPGPVKPLDAVQLTVQKLATRLMAIRGALLARVTPEVPWMVPDLSALLPDGPLPLETGEFEVTGDDGESTTVTFDERVVVEGVDLPSLTRLARGDWAALTWLLWSAGSSQVELPTQLTPPETFPQAAGMAANRLWRARDQRVFNGRNARAHGVEGFSWEGADVADLHPNLASIAEQQYAEVQAIFFWLSQPAVRSPWQDDLRGS